MTLEAQPQEVLSVVWPWMIHIPDGFVIISAVKRCASVLLECEAYLKVSSKWVLPVLVIQKIAICKLFEIPSLLLRLILLGMVSLFSDLADRFWSDKCITHIPVVSALTSSYPVTIFWIMVWLSDKVWGLATFSTCFLILSGLGQSCKDFVLLLMFWGAWSYFFKLLWIMRRGTLARHSGKPGYANLKTTWIFSDTGLIWESQLFFSWEGAPYNFLGSFFLWIKQNLLDLYVFNWQFTNGSTVNGCLHSWDRMVAKDEEDRYAIETAFFFSYPFCCSWYSSE